MSFRTRAQLRTNARVRADQDNSTFPDDTAYNVYLDDAAREVWYDLLAAGWPVNFSSKTITANGSASYPLSASGNVATVVGVYFVQGGIEFYPLHRVNEGKRAALRSSTYMPSGFAGFYEVRIDPTSGPVVEFMPKPTSGTYQVDYTLEFPGFTGDSDVWYGPGRSDEMVALKAAIKGCLKEDRQNAAASLEKEYAALYQKVTATASWFDQRNPAQIRDVNSENGRYAFDYPLAGPDPVGY